MFVTIWVIVAGFCIGHLAKLVHPGPDPEGFWITTLIGIFGSVIGQAIASFVSCDSNVFFSVAGGVIVCSLWRFWKNIA